MNSSPLLLSSHHTHTNTYQHFCLLQLAYCIVQFLEKDPTLTEPVSDIWLTALLFLFDSFVFMSHLICNFLGDKRLIKVLA